MAKRIEVGYKFEPEFKDQTGWETREYTNAVFYTPNNGNLLVYYFNKETDEIFYYPVAAYAPNTWLWARVLEE